MGFMDVLDKLYTHVCLTVNSSKSTMANPAFFCFNSLAIKFSEQFLYCLILELNAYFIVPGSYFRLRLWDNQSINYIPSTIRSVKNKVVVNQVSGI